MTITTGYKIYDDEIGIVIADVSGKGVPAAILMAFLRSSLRAATHIGYATHISMAKVNYLLWESIERNQFVTAFHGILDASNGHLSYSNAGHNPPLLINANGRFAVYRVWRTAIGNVSGDAVSPVSPVDWSRATCWCFTQMA